MAYSIAQKEIPSTPGHCKFVKKSRTRKLRREFKKVFSTNPLYNKYKGYS